MTGCSSGESELEIWDLGFGIWALGFGLWEFFHSEWNAVSVCNTVVLPAFIHVVLLYTHHS